MHVCICMCVYGKYQNPTINRAGILKSYATRRIRKRVYGFLALIVCVSNPKNVFRESV